MAKGRRAYSPQVRPVEPLVRHGNLTRTQTLTIAMTPRPGLIAHVGPAAPRGITEDFGGLEWS